MFFFFFFHLIDWRLREKQSSAPNLFPLLCVIFIKLLLVFCFPDLWFFVLFFCNLVYGYWDAFVVFLCQILMGCCFKILYSYPYYVFACISLPQHIGFESNLCFENAEFSISSIFFPSFLAIICWKRIHVVCYFTRMFCGGAWTFVFFGYFTDHVSINIACKLFALGFWIICAFFFVILKANL